MTADCRLGNSAEVAGILSIGDIPLEAKILAVAYEAMTSDRVYRRSIGERAARRQLESCSGTQFDPRVVEAFLAVLGRANEEPVTIRSVATRGGPHFTTFPTRVSLIV